MADYHSVEHDGFTVETNSGTLADTQAALGITPEPTPSTDAPAATDAEPSPERPRDPATGQFLPKDETAPDKPAEKPRTGKPRDDPRARVEQAIARQREAERRAEAAERELATLRGRVTAPESKAPVPADRTSVSTTAPTNGTGDDPEPQLGSFDSYEAYVKAQARWEARQEIRHEIAEQQRQWQQQERQRQQQDRASKFKAQIDAAQATDPDVLERIRPELLAMKPVSQLDEQERHYLLSARRIHESFIAEAVLRSDRALSLLQHFSDHPDDLQRFALLPPEDIFREIGRLEARLDAATPPGTARTPAVTKAKPLIKPTGGAPTTSDPNEITDDLSFEEHFRRMNAADRQRGRRV